MGSNEQDLCQRKRREDASLGRWEDAQSLHFKRFSYSRLGRRSNSQSVRRRQQDTWMDIFLKDTCLGWRPNTQSICKWWWKRMGLELGFQDTSTPARVDQQLGQEPCLARWFKLGCGTSILLAYDLQKVSHSLS